ncbi:hypothetical protein FPHYL_13934 [Fusarium phyllophilum]|uniref:Uncharacterized protein n=1 Tax=Fusarium phyllophilum TaxID=47803 RepID=A0A8H5I6E6_9HYPO|nr:hypothetical protein FPHYL_13934 [Fusarium phyllophilum]
MPKNAKLEWLVEGKHKSGHANVIAELRALHLPPLELCIQFEVLDVELYIELSSKANEFAYQSSYYAKQHFKLGTPMAHGNMEFQWCKTLSRRLSNVVWMKRDSTERESRTDIQTFGNTEKKIPGVGEELFAVQTPAKAPLLLGYLELSEHYIESGLEASSESSSALYDASKGPFHDPGPHFELMPVHFKKILTVSMLEYKSSHSPGLQVAFLPHFSLNTIH